VAKKKKSGGRRSKRPAIRSPANSAAGRTNVILEEMRQQQNVVIDAVKTVEEKLSRRIDETRRDLVMEIDVLKIAVRQNGADIQKSSADIQRISGELQNLTQEVRTMSNKLDTKGDTSSVEKLEQRVDTLERRTG
jgi:hypothetical protein